MRLARPRTNASRCKDYRVQGTATYSGDSSCSAEVTVTTLGELPVVDTDVIENLFSTDLAYLQEFLPSNERRRAPPRCTPSALLPTEFDGGSTRRR